MNLFTNLLTINLVTMTGQQSWELLAWTMCYFLAAGCVVALVGALVRFLCKRLSPQIRYTVSLGVFATLAMLPLGIALGLSQRMPVAKVLNAIVIDLADTPITMSPVEEPIELINITVVETPTTEAVPFVVALARQNDGAREHWVDRAIEFLPWVWLIGTPLTFLLLATGLIGSNRLRRQCKQLTEGPIVKTCERLRTTLAVSQRVGIAINERIASPLLIGIVRPLILLPPAALTGWSPDELEMVLLHELAHVRRWDNLVNFGQRLVESLLFFHPAVWWVSRWVRRDREECCDAVVVAQTEKPQAYAELLVALATPPSLSTSLSSPPLAGMAMAQHPLAGRIRRILHLEEEKMLITRSTLGLVGFFVVAVLGVVLWQPVTPTIAQETNTPAVALGSAGGSTLEAESIPGNLATEDTEIIRSVEAIFVAPDLAFANPKQGEIWLATQTALIKSDFVLSQAMEPFADDGTQYPVPTVEWLQDRLRVRFMRAAVVLSLDAKKGDRVPNSVLGSYLKSIGKTYVTEWKKSAKFANGNQPSPFPSLEAQRAADLAYKLLGVELEQLDKEELARVKAMKFAGGLRVSKEIRKSRNSTALIAFGDLLVGLHVWPTTSLADVKKVLDRDDLQDLSPLKFYVIRKTSEDDGSYGGGYGAEAKSKTVDQLVTGRIEVNVDAMKKTAVGGVIIPPGDPLGQPSITQRLKDSYRVVPTIGRIKPMLMIFVAPNTAPGKEMTRRLSVVLKKLQGQVDAFLVDTGKNPELAKKYQVTTIPTCLLFHNDKQIGTFVGVLPAGKLEELITSSIKQLNLPQTLPPQSTLPNSSSRYSTPPVRSILKSNTLLKPHTLAPGDSVKVVAVNVFPDQPIADVYRIEEMGSLALGPTYGRIKVAGLTLLEAEKKVEEKLKALVKDAAVQLTLESKAATNPPNGVGSF